MSFVGNFPRVQAGKKPKNRTHCDNMKKNQVTTTAENEDDTDSTATKTTAIFTSNCELDWDSYTDDGIIEETTSNNHTYSFGRRRWVKPACKWKTPTPQVFKGKRVLTDA